MRVAIVKYNAGNVLSVVNALRRLGIEPQITDSAKELASADKVIFPGQGEASSTMAYLREHGLDRVIKSLRQPVLGICIGQQLLCKSSEEGGGTECLGVFDADVRLFRPARHEDKVPAMGWNALTGLKSRLFDGVAEGDYAVPVNIRCDGWVSSTAVLNIHVRSAMHYNGEAISGTVVDTIYRRFIMKAPAGAEG